MTKAVKYAPWSIRVDGVQWAEDRWISSLFCIGNGHFMLRNTLPFLHDVERTYRGMFCEGVFEYIKGNITDMVNLPDPFDIHIQVGKEKLESASQLTSLSRSLDFKRGVVHVDFEFGGRSFSLEAFVSHSDMNLAALRLTTSAKPDVSITDSFFTDVANLPVNDDQVTKNETEMVLLKDIVQRAAGDGISSLSFSTVCGTSSFTFTRKDSCHERDGLIIHESLVSIAGQDLAERTYESEKARSIEALSAIWSVRDICIEGPDESLQCAVRFNIFQLIQNEMKKDISIGARGLTHGRYKGCYFWDTDVFILPYYLLVSREASAHIARYRIDSLESARRLSRRLGTKGARYPWMASLDGSEQCESWDTGKCELHVTADVAWALSRYDDAFSLTEEERREIAQVQVECARFHLSRFTYNPSRDAYDLMFVKGPDEYCGVTRNNAYTNHMAAWNVSLALEAAHCGLVELGDGEEEEFRHFLEKVTRPYSPLLGTILEDENYLNLEPVDLEEIKKSDEALYRSHDYDALQRMRILKQPDVLLLYVMDPSLFHGEDGQNAWREYEKRCAHDSTLSWPLHALIAYKLGRSQEAWAYLKKSLFLDLENLMSNTQDEGIHIGAVGASLEALLYGMLALPFSRAEKCDGKAMLPEEIVKISFNHLSCGQLVHTECTKSEEFV